MPKYAPNKMPTALKKRYFELLREGYKGAAAARVVGISASCGSNWFIEAGSMILPDPVPISPRFLTQDDRIAIADGLHARHTVKDIAASIGKSFQTVYREIKRNAKPDGSYHPWWAHNQALWRRNRPKEAKIRSSEPLRTLVREKLTEKWSPQQISRYLARKYANDAAMRACTETIYRALFAGLLGHRDVKLRTGRTRRKRQRRGVPTLNKIKNMTLIHERPVEADDRRIPGHWEGDLIIGRGQGSAIGTLVERTTRYAFTRSMWNALYPMPLDLSGSLSTLTPMSFHKGHCGKGEKGTATSAAKAVASRRNRSSSAPRALARFPRRSTA
jgi:transposase, IS30 family